MVYKTKQIKQHGNVKKIFLFLKQNYFLLVIMACVGFVGLVEFYKLFISKPTYVYTKVKVGQGLWWASTQKPSLWFVKAIQQAKEQKDLTGKPIASVLDVSYYPYTASSYLSGQYDAYVTLKLKVSKVGGSYSFNRNTIGVGSSIDLEFPNVQFSGTIIALSTTPFHDQYTEKTVYLTNRLPLPWEYDQIHIGDSQTNGNQTVFTILDKSYGEVTDTTYIQQGTLVSTPTSLYTVKAQIRVKKVNGQDVFGEEYVVAPGKLLQGVATDNFTFTDYYITKVE